MITQRLRIEPLDDAHVFGFGQQVQPDGDGLLEGRDVGADLSLESPEQFIAFEPQRVRPEVERRLMHDLRDLLGHAIEKSLDVWLVGSCPRPQRLIDRPFERIAVARQQLEIIAIRVIDCVLRAAGR
jgi:hypothetical protein